MNIDQSDNVDALVLQVLALRSQGEIDAAIAMCDRAAGLAETRDDITLLAFELIGQRDGAASALAHLENAVSHSQDSRELSIALGIALSRTPRRSEALDHFRRALAHDPEDTETAFRAAHIALERRDVATAIALIEATADVHPGAQMVLVQGAVLCAEEGEHSSAEHLLTKATAIAPLSGESAHIAAAVRGETGAILSPRDVATQFDRHAASFDENLGALGYAGPDMIARALTDSGLDGERDLDVLDAGCGTGLCGPVVRPLAKTLRGIDLSPEMVRLAAKRGCYDSGTTQDIRTLGETNPAAFDLVISADVLGYFGDLSESLASLRACLRPGGHAVVTIEALEDPDNTAEYHLQPSGRYRHRAEYLENAMIEAGFTVAHPAIRGILRYQYDRPVYGTTMVGSACAK